MEVRLAGQAKKESCKVFGGSESGPVEMELLITTAGELGRTTGSA